MIVPVNNRIKKYYLLIYTLTGMIVNLPAQQITDSITNHLLMPSKEIPGNRITDIATDSQGNIYATSKIGLMKWDGKLWYQYKVYDQWGQHSLKKVAADNYNNVWVISIGQNLIKLNLPTLTYYDFKLYCYDLIPVDGLIYASAYKHMLKINPLTMEFDTINNPEEVTALHLHQDNKGNIWGTCMFADKIYQLHDDTVILHKQLNGVSAADIILLSVIDTNYYAIITTSHFKLFNEGSYITIDPPISGDFYVNSLQFLPDSTLLLTSEKGVHIYKNGTWKKIDNYNNAQTSCIISKDSIAIAYESDGVSIGTTNNLTSFKGADIDDVAALAYHNNTLFVGSYAGYVSQWNGSEITTAGTVNPLFYGCRQLKVSPKNVLYSAGYSGVHRYVNNKWESIIDLYGLPEIRYFKMDFDSNNTLYVSASDKGLYNADSTGIINHYDADNSPIVSYTHGVLFDSKNRLWIGCYGESKSGELYTLENNQFIKHEIEGFSGGGIPISFLEDSKGNIWVGSLSYEDEYCSLARFNGTVWDTLHYEEQMPWLGNSAQPIMNIYEDYKGNIWLATIYAYMYDGIKWSRFNDHFGIGQGSTEIYDISGDGKGNIFLGSTDLGTLVLTYDDAGIIVPKAKKLQALSIFPNPSNGEVNLNWQKSGESHVKVYNAEGKLVLSDKTFGLNPILNLSNLTKGQYVINITNDDSFGSSVLILK